MGGRPAASAEPFDSAAAKRAIIVRIGTIYHTRRWDAEVQTAPTCTRPGLCPGCTHQRRIPSHIISYKPLPSAKSDSEQRCLPLCLLFPYLSLITAQRLRSFGTRKETIHQRWV